MFLVDCPYCEEGAARDRSLLTAGEAHIVRPGAKAQGEMSDEGWAEFMFIRDNVRGKHAERWWHEHGCNRFFNAVRNTVTDRFVVTYKMGDPRPGDAS